MRRSVVAMTIGMLAMLVLAAPVAAGRRWCARDPIVTLNGEAVQIWLAIPEEFQPAVTGPIAVKVAIPEGVESNVIYLDDGFNGHGETVKFTTLDRGTVTKSDPDGTIASSEGSRESDADGSFPIEVKVRFPVDRDVLRSLGARGNRVPLRITVVTNGELVTVENGPLAVVNGETFEVTGSTWGTTVKARVSPST